jgi:hypothetical protein
LELTAHQAQHVILDRSTCSRNPVPMLVAHFLGQRIRLAILSSTRSAFSLTGLDQVLGGCCECR